MSGLIPQLRARLIRAARQALALHLTGTMMMETLEEPWPEVPNHGVFVTLRKGAMLRGCIGTFRPEEGLPQTVRTMAVAAAHDVRFTAQPISATELPALRIEVSILSPLRRLGNPVDFELGIDGIYVRQGYFSGCFLPDVASERGWDREQFLSVCCEQKAGLAGDAWRALETEVYAFTVEKIVDDPAAAGS